MCYHYPIVDDSYADAVDQDDADADANQAGAVAYRTTLTAPGGQFTTPLGVDAVPHSDGGYRVVLTPDADPDAPKTFHVRGAKTDQGVRAFVDTLVASFRQPYDPANPADRLIYELGLGSSSLSNVLRAWAATDQTDYAARG